MCAQLSPTLWTLWMVARLEFSRQEHWNGLPFPPARDLPDPGIEPMSPMAIPGAFFTTEPPGKPSFMWPFSYIRASVVAQLVKNLPAVWETWVQSLGWEKRLANSLFWPRKLHGLYSPLGCKKSDRTEWLSRSLSFLLSFLPLKIQERMKEMAGIFWKRVECKMLLIVLIFTII